MANEFISNKLKALRLRAGFTQKQVYETLGVSQSTFSSWEIGKSEPDAQTFLLLCQMYKIDDILFEFTGKSLSEEGKDEELSEIIRAYETADLKSKNIARQALDLPPIKAQNNMEVAKESYIEKELQAYRKELEAEEKGKTSPVSEDVKGA